MRLIRRGSRSYFSQYISTRIKLAEAETQLSTLRVLGNAIKEERRILEQALKREIATAAMPRFVPRGEPSSQVRIG
jgi:hypothetical protein